MFEDIPLVYGNIRILSGLSLVYKKNFMRYVCLIFSGFLVFTQFYYMFFTQDGVDALIRNAYGLVLWSNTLLRAFFLNYNRGAYERLIENLLKYYHELLQSKNDYVLDMLTAVNKAGSNMTRGNLFLGILTCIGFYCYPMFSAERELPFGSMIPGIDQYESPYYECLYSFQMLITPIGCCMYIPYTSLIVSFIMFGIVMCKTLQHRLRMLKHTKASGAAINAEIIECIKYHKRIIEYVSTVNTLTMFIFSLEFLAFGTLLCALLFLLIIVNASAIPVVCAYITMILAQILALYWYANELREQNLAIANAAYDTDWFTFPICVQKNIMLLIVRAQRPSAVSLVLLLCEGNFMLTLQLLIGNTYPMTLELFQSLLNASYSYFTLLKRVYR